MKKVIIGSLVGTVIFFVFQAVMWEGGFHTDFSSYSAKQDTILNMLNANLDKDGLYMMPMADANNPDFKAQEKKIENNSMGHPWAMIFYHRSMEFTASYLIMGILYTLIACLIASLVIYNGKFSSFGSRFLVAMAFALFVLAQGVFNNMNWWSFPWSWVKPQVIDLTIGWGLCSVWLAFFVKKIKPEAKL